MLKKVSKKQQKINKELKEVYQQISQERPHYCTGCGRSDVPLSHSHIIPRSRRKDLITDKNNITYHCLSMGGRKGCHEIWDSNDRVSLLDYHDNMEYIRTIDTEYYYLICD